MTQLDDRAYTHFGTFEQSPTPTRVAKTSEGLCSAHRLSVYELANVGASIWTGNSGIRSTDTRQFVSTIKYDVGYFAYATIQGVLLEALFPRNHEADVSSWYVRNFAKLMGNYNYRLHLGDAACRYGTSFYFLMGKVNRSSLELAINFGHKLGYLDVYGDYANKEHYVDKLGKKVFFSSQYLPSDLLPYAKHGPYGWAVASKRFTKAPFLILWENVAGANAKERLSTLLQVPEEVSNLFSLVGPVTDTVLTVCDKTGFSLVPDYVATFKKTGEKDMTFNGAEETWNNKGGKLLFSPIGENLSVAKKVLKRASEKRWSVLFDAGLN